MRWFVFFGQFDDERVTEVGRYLERHSGSYLAQSCRVTVTTCSELRPKFASSHESVIGPERHFACL